MNTLFIDRNPNEEQAGGQVVTIMDVGQKMNKSGDHPSM